MSTAAAAKRAPVSAVAVAGEEPANQQWRLLRAHIKVVGAVVDPETGVERPAALDPKKPLQIAGIANAAIVDRVNETLDPRGAVLVNYLKNPVILADHNYNRPIGIATLVEVKDDGVHFAADIGRPDLAPLTADQEEKRSLIAQGILCTVSVGFIPLEMQPAEYDDAGNLVKAAIYTRWELLEISVVSVPCNADSIFQMKELEMTTARRAAGTVPMTAVKTPPAAPAASGDAGATDDEPVTGTAGEMLKAVLDHVGGMKEMLGTACSQIGEMHKGIADLHTKVDKLGPKADPEDAADGGADDAAEGDAPPPKKDAAAAAAAKAADDRLTKLEESLGKLAGAMTALGEGFKALKGTRF